MRAPRRRRQCPALAQPRFDGLHRLGEILVRPGPARGMNAGLPAQRFHDQTGIVGEGRQAGGGRSGRFRLDGGVLGKARAGLLRFAELQLARRNRIDAICRQQVAHFPQLAGIVGGDDELARDGAVLCRFGQPGHDVAPMPLVTSPPSSANRSAGRRPCARARAVRETAPR